MSFALLALPARAADPVLVVAAASTGEALEALAESYPAQVTFSFAGSGAAARQVAAGLPADVVVLASPQWMDWLTQQGALRTGAAVPLLGNRLAVIAPAGTPPLPGAAALARALGGDRLAMGQRAAVPAGVYAQQWLQAEGLWPVLKGQLAETDSVRAALALVARGQAPFGVVYATDARASAAVDVVFEVPAAAHDPIRYPAAALSPAGAAFLAHLESAQARAVFARFGFEDAQGDR